jgi:hypothetical protein
MQNVGEQRYRTTNQAVLWLAAQIEAQTRKIEAAELALKGGQATAGFGTLEEERIPLEQRLREVNVAYIGARTRRMEAEATHATMAAAPDAQQLPEVLRDVTAQTLRAQMDTLDRQLAQLREKYLDQHPEVVRVRAQMAVTSEALAAEARRVVKAAELQYQAALGQEQRLLAALEETRAALAQTSRKAVSYDTPRGATWGGQDGPGQPHDAPPGDHGGATCPYRTCAWWRRPPRRSARTGPRLPRALLWGLVGAVLASGWPCCGEARRPAANSRRRALRLNVPLLTVVPEVPRGAAVR